MSLSQLHHHSAHFHELMGVNPLDWVGFMAIGSFSLLASLHCAFMCAPLVCASLGSESHYKSYSLWIYNITRLISYSSMGFCLGAISKKVLEFSSWAGSLLAITLGIFLCLLALTLALKKTPQFKLPFLPKFVDKVTGFYSRFALSRPGWQKALLLGLFTVFLPCASLTPALAMALGSHNPFWGGAFMLAFAVGTFPIMIISPSAARFSLNKMPRAILGRLSSVLLLGVGLITILRAL